MSGIQAFSRKDQTIDNARPIFTVPVINAGNSSGIGGGFCHFQKCELEHTVTGYNEILYIISGKMSLRQGDKRWNVGPGDILWIPKDTKFVYEAGDEMCVTFYATDPATMSGSTKKTDACPEIKPVKVG